jgi:hypothetical protein
MISAQVAPTRSSRPSPGIASPTPHAPCTAVAGIARVAHGSRPRLVAIRIAWASAGSAVGSDSPGAHCEQNMSRATSWLPSARGSRAGGVGRGAGARAGVGASARYRASTSAPAARAANPAHTPTVNSVNSQGRRASPTDQRRVGQAKGAGAEAEDTRVDRRIV